MAAPEAVVSQLHSCDIEEATMFLEESHSIDSLLLATPDEPLTSVNMHR